MADDMFGAPTTADVSFEAMLACVDRELKMRRSVYPRWVQQGKLSQDAADLEILRMRAVRRALMHYEAVLGTGVVIEEVVSLVESRYTDLLKRYPEANGN